MRSFIYSDKARQGEARLPPTMTTLGERQRQPPCFMTALAWQEKEGGGGGKGKEGVGRGGRQEEGQRKNEVAYKKESPDKNVSGSGRRKHHGREGRRR